MENVQDLGKPLTHKPEANTKKRKKENKNITMIKEKQIGSIR